MILRHGRLYSFCLLDFLSGLGGCANPRGVYVLNAYDGDGKPINLGYSFLAHGRTVYSVINGTCPMYPGARVMVIDKKTGRKATDLRPPQCRK